VNDDVKSIIIDLVENSHINDQFFKKLNEIDKRIVRRFIKATKLDSKSTLGEGLIGNDDEFRKRFEILRGEYNSGNDSQILKNELKQYTIQAYHEGSMSHRDAMMLLYQLSLP
jgi:hypothetical protein